MHEERASEGMKDNWVLMGEERMIKQKAEFDFKQNKRKWQEYIFNQVYYLKHKLLSFPPVPLFDHC